MNKFSQKIIMMIKRRRLRDSSSIWRINSHLEIMVMSHLKPMRVVPVK